jgi:AcrR family transcriptional regulator
MASVELGLRSTPQQARSRATMKLILEVSAELLEEVGFDGFNTNLLAERAGIGTRAIYRYFPNKLAILVAMVNDVRAAENAWIGDLRHLGADGDWRAATEQAIDGYFEAASRTPGYAALRAAVQATPELNALERMENKRLEDDLAEGLRALGVSIGEAHLGALCRTIMESSSRMLDSALQSPKGETELLVRELKLMIVSLLENYMPA